MWDLLGIVWIVAIVVLFILARSPARDREDANFNAVAVLLALLFPLYLIFMISQARIERGP